MAKVLTYRGDCKMNWTKWQSITLANVPSTKKSGVYEIRLMDRNSKPRSTHRLLKKDTDGVLYIGCTVDLKYRMITRFLKSLDRGNGHVAGNRLAKWSKAGKINFVNENFEYRYRDVPKNKLKVEEKKELRNYESNYGQFPALNRI